VQDAWKFDSDVLAIAANAQILDLLGKLYGRPAFPFQTLNFPVGTQQDAHSDSVHFSSLPERFMCGVWLAMEDISPDAGPLFYYPGSHRWPVLSNALIGRRGFGSTLDSAQDPFVQGWRSLCDAAGAQQEVFLARKGQALIWCANLLHGGSLQTDPRLTRWSQVTHYYFENCTYYTPAFSDETIGRLQLREVKSISDGRSRPNLYLGQAYETERQPASVDANSRKSIWQSLKRLLGCGG
jgi:ectoine hydroxylase-related dioxygenase (phytanoyl-CoA dioxygenase family)